MCENFIWLLLRVRSLYCNFVYDVCKIVDLSVFDRFSVAEKLLLQVTVSSRMAVFYRSCNFYKPVGIIGLALRYSVMCHFSQWREIIMERTKYLCGHTYIDTLCLKKRHRCCIQWLQRTSTNSSNFWHRSCRESMLANKDLLSHLS